MLPNEYSLQKSTARKSPTPSNATVPGARAKRRTLRGSQAKAIERLSGIKKTPSKKIDSKIALEKKDSSFNKSSAISKSMDILAKGNTRNIEKKTIDNESSVAQSYRSSNMFDKESSKGNTSSRMETTSYK